MIQTLSQLREQARLDSPAPFALRVRADRPTALDELTFSLWGELMDQFPLLVFQGFEAVSREGLVKLGKSLPGQGLLEWDFGPVMEMKENPESPNYLFSREEVPLHWDGAFFKEPSHLLFHCVEAPTAGAGGETLFCDTQARWARASREERAQWEFIQLTYRTEKLAHYGGEIQVPLVQAHPRQAQVILRFAEPVVSERNPVSVEVQGLENGDAAAWVRAMGESFRAPGTAYTHSWTEGDYVIADNARLLHGRNAFSKDCPRHLRRVQIL